MYERESLTLDEVQYVLYSRALQSKLETKTEPGEGLSMKGRSKKYNPKGKFHKSRSKLRNRQ